MARKTFGRSGNPINIADPETERITITESSVAGEDGNASLESGSSEREPEFTVISASDGTGSEDRGIGSEDTFADPNATRTTTGAKPRKKYTRRTKTETTATANASNVITANLEKVLFNLHVMAAGFLSEPDIRISEDESKLLADAVQEVATAYGLTAVLSPKTQAAIDMSIALVTVYGGRVVKIINKPKQRGPVQVMRPQQPVNHSVVAAQPSPVEQQNPGGKPDPFSSVN